MAKILLIGDNFTQQFPENFIGDKRDEIINQSFDNIGVATYHKNIWPKISEEDIDIIVFLLGFNNIINPDIDNDELNTINDTIEKIKKFINDLSRTDARIILQSLYPTRSEKLNLLIKTVNEKILEHCYGMDIEYLDMYDLLTDKNGLLKENYTTDGIHITNMGYTLIANQINDFIETINKDK